MKLSSQLAVLTALAAATPAFAQVKLNDTVSITGWATGSYQNTKPSPGVDVDSTNLDAALLGFTITPPKTPVTAVFSAYYHPSSEGGVSPSGSEFTMLDAYITYAASSTVNVTVGKFLSYLGYESFYPNQDNMISLANQAFLGPIPGYHEGAKVDITLDKTDTIGFSVTDSEYQKPGYAATEGDGEFKHSAGFEGYYTNTAITNLTFWAGVGYDTKTKPGEDTGGVENPAGHDVWVGDVWASYVLDKNNDKLVGEEIYKDGGSRGNKGSNWLVYYQYNFDPKTYAWFCVSGEDVTNGPSYTKFSISPTYNLTANLAIRAQYSYIKYKDYTADNANFFGAQVIFSF